MYNAHQISQVARRIARALGEKEKLPQHQIKRIVQVCGARQAQTWLKEIQAIEQQGGMLTSDGTQRRTPGGAYFRLVRTSLLQTGQKEKMQMIFRGKRSEEEKRRPTRSHSKRPSRYNTVPRRNPADKQR